METSNFVIAKLVPSPEQESSQWILSHIKAGTTIGIENIPIYQGLPDIVLKEYYEEQKNIAGNYTYQVIDSKTKVLPRFIIITNGGFDTKYLIKSDKKDLIKRLENNHYHIVSNFMPYFGVNSVFGNELNYNLSSITEIFPISIYEKS